jgi:hypothetical protein
VSEQNTSGCYTSLILLRHISQIRDDVTFVHTFKHSFHATVAGVRGRLFGRKQATRRLVSELQCADEAHSGIPYTS